MELVGPLAPNGKLDEKAEFLFEGKFTGGESIVVKDGNVYTGLIGGDVVKIDETIGEISVIARFGNPCGKVFPVNIPRVCTSQVARLWEFSLHFRGKVGRIHLRPASWVEI